MDDFDKQYAEAVERGRIAAEIEPRAAAARYDRRKRRVVVELTNGCLFAFPVSLSGDLRNATHEQSAAVEVFPGGYGLHWEELDVDLSVPGLFVGAFGPERWIAQYAGAMGRVGGKASTEAKAVAARANGRKGGRPRKIPDVA
ncbi:MAG TPA: DUF2442 domain-containing protein [Longimicrobium sp.]|nr:DUF2442 domain-containing protein [Longimicrobium sp.]